MKEAVMQLQVTKATLVSFFLATLAMAASPQLSCAQAWTPPPNSSNQPAGDPLKLPEVAKMPDVVGVRLGMIPVEALQIVHRLYPADRYQEMKVTWWPTVQKPDFGFNVIMPDPLGTPDVYLSFTAPPNRQVVWKVVRMTHKINVNRATLLAALREKYGKESYATTEGGGPAVTEDRAIGHLVWLFDEHGNRAPLPAAQAFPSFGTIWQCFANYNGMLGNAAPTMPRSDSEVHGHGTWCSSFVGIHVAIGSGEIIANTTTEMVDIPLAARTAHAAELWQKNAEERARQEELDKSKKAKPSL